MNEHTNFRLSEEQLDELAERAADKALEKVYIQIGKSIVQKALWIIGASILPVYLFLKSKGLA